jgi:hypothetical protein
MGEAGWQQDLRRVTDPTPKRSTQKPKTEETITQIDQTPPNQDATNNFSLNSNINPYNYEDHRHSSLI